VDQPLARALTGVSAKPNSRAAFVGDPVAVTTAIERLAER
jgi:hypothetical protein